MKILETKLSRRQTLAAAGAGVVAATLGGLRPAAAAFAIASARAGLWSPEPSDANSAASSGRASGRERPRVAAPSAKRRRVRVSMPPLCGTGRAWRGNSIGVVNGKSRFPNGNATMVSLAHRR